MKTDFTLEEAVDVLITKRLIKKSVADILVGETSLVFANGKPSWLLEKLFSLIDAKITLVTDEDGFADGRKYNVWDNKKNCFM